MAREARRGHRLARLTAQQALQAAVLGAAGAVAEGFRHIRLGLIPDDGPPQHVAGAGHEAQHDLRLLAARVDVEVRRPFVIALRVQELFGAFLVQAGPPFQGQQAVGRFLAQLQQGAGPFHLVLERIRRLGKGILARRGRARFVGGIGVHRRGRELAGALLLLLFQRTGVGVDVRAGGGHLLSDGGGFRFQALPAVVRAGERLFHHDAYIIGHGIGRPGGLLGGGFFLRLFLQHLDEAAAPQQGEDEQPAKEVGKKAAEKHAAW